VEGVRKELGRYPRLTPDVDILEVIATQTFEAERGGGGITERAEADATRAGREEDGLRKVCVAPTRAVLLALWLLRG